MKVLKILMFFLLPFVCHAQRENNIWYFGDKAGLDFNSGNPVNLTDGQIFTIEGCAAISNISGQLLFYTDGRTVWNRNHQVMSNGSGLRGHASSTQSAIIVPKPNSNTIYYIFTTSERADSNGICYSEVDITLNGGLGDVTANKNIQLYAPTCEKICAVKNLIDGTYWVVTHGFENNSFLAFKIDASGVAISPVISNVGTFVGSVNPLGNYNVQGYLKFSPSGSKLVCVNAYINVELFDFDIVTGLIRNPIVVNRANQNRYCYGAEFSPSGNILYLSSSNSSSTEASKIFQYNLLSSNIQASEIQINTTNARGLGALQLASNCKIYAANSSTTLGNRSLYVINNPDILGLNCDFQSSNVTLSGRCWVGLPQFIEYSTCKNRTIIHDDICIGGNTTFSLGGSENITTALWRFGDGNTSTNINGQNNYNAAGTYIVSGDFTTPTGNFSISKQIIVPENPVANTPEDITLCGQTNLAYDLSTLSATILGNQSTNIYGVSYFASMADATSHNNILSPIQTYATQSTVVYAKVYRLTNFACYGITSFKILLSEYPILNPISEFKICDDGLTNDGFVTFDLSTKTAEFLNGQSPNDFKVSYHLTLSDAQNNINPILTPITNTSNPQTIYARIATLPTEQCYHTTSFSLVVKPSPEFDLKPFYVLCEGNGNYVEIIVPNTFSSYLWSTGSQTFWTQTQITGRFWVTVRNQMTNGFRCSRTKEFQVVLANKATIKKIKIQDWTDNQNSILILLDSNSLGEYEYSIDGINYQDSNFFDGLTAKEYTVYVREKNGCGITTDEIFLLMYPKFFTPNNDGYHDEWTIQFSETEPNLSIKIFDRYGKILNTSTSWDGNFEGNPLPSDDYWFVVTRENRKEYKGHFTLKR